jgi:drug/metabolite transporter (DMT)-like permease
MSQAYKLEKSSVITPIAYIQIVIEFFWDIIIFKAKIRLNDFIGSFLIIGVILIVLFLRIIGVIK